MRAAILAVVIALVAAAASATERRTDELLWMCEGRVSDNEFENAMEQALCIGYIDGIVDSNPMMQGFLGVQLFVSAAGRHLARSGDAHLPQVGERPP